MGSAGDGGLMKRNLYKDCVCGNRLRAQRTYVGERLVQQGCEDAADGTLSCYIPIGASVTGMSKIVCCGKCDKRYRFTTMKVALEDSIDNMRKIAGRSNGLWRPVNEHILRCLETGKKEGLDNKQIAELLLHGVRRTARKDEPIAIDNRREAARQIRRGELVDVV